MAAAWQASTRLCSGVQEPGPEQSCTNALYLPFSEQTEVVSCAGCRTAVERCITGTDHAERQEEQALKQAEHSAHTEASCCQPSSNPARDSASAGEVMMHRRERSMDLPHVHNAHFALDKVTQANLHDVANAGPMECSTRCPYDCCGLHIMPAELRRPVKFTVHCLPTEASGHEPQGCKAHAAWPTTIFGPSCAVAEQVTDEKEVTPETHTAEPLWPTFCGTSGGLWNGQLAAFSPATGG